MQITFGLHLDGRLGPPAAATFGAAIVGRTSFLELLETYLGLAQPSASAAKRITSYLGYLRQHEDKPRFYSSSLLADSVGTAAKLLAWRDEWILAGWDGSMPVGAPKKLAEMALVERSAAGNVPPGEAERLMTVVTALETQPCPITSVILVEPLESFTRAWRNVLAKLPNVSYRESKPQGKGQLRHLQERALEALDTGQTQSLDTPILDGSVLLMEPSSQELAEHWLSAITRHCDLDRLILCEADGDSLDATLIATGAAACGFKSSSSLRPALQALGLAFEMCWLPVDMHRLMEFLTHPVGPFSRKSRTLLARALSRQPGIGGEAWMTTKAKIQSAPNGSVECDEIAYWLEGKKWSRLEGVPVDVLLEQTDKLVSEFQKRLSDDEQSHSAFAPAVAQCTAVREGLTEFKSQGVNHLLPRQIDQLVAHSIPAGAPNPRITAQVGCLRAEASAGACINSADEVIWWMPSSVLLPSMHPWSEREISVLRECGLELRDPKQELEAQARQWLMPLLAAKSRFVVMLPPAGAEEHPFLQLLKRLAPNITAQSVRLQELQVDEPTVGIMQEVQHKPLNPSPRYIQLDQGLALPSTPQSYTSLTELVNNPALYALKRIAHLRPSSGLTVDDNNRLLGTLAHRVIELLFKNPDSLAWSKDQALNWFRNSIDELLRTEGAVLQMHGSGVSKQRFKSVCEGAIGSLLEHFRAAGVLEVHTEYKLEGMLGDVQIEGSADLVLVLPGDRCVVLDIKWSGDNLFKSILAQGEHLQLAMYSSLVKQQKGLDPVALGYFILQSGSIYLTNPFVMPLAQIVSPPSGANSLLLDQALASWKWRAQQWADGLIEVVPLDPDEEFQGADGTLPVRGPRAWDKDYLALMGGWE
ncbi:MAG: PD-(D/E)XK nuclease family protein [Pseudoalteromonas distincta]